MILYQEYHNEIKQDLTIAVLYQVWNSVQNSGSVSLKLIFTVTRKNNFLSINTSALLHFKTARWNDIAIALFLRPSPNISNYHFNNTVCIIEQDILRKAKCLVKIRILGSREYHANRKTAKSMF